MRAYQSIFETRCSREFEETREGRISVSAPEAAGDHQPRFPLRRLLQALLHRTRAQRLATR